MAVLRTIRGTRRTKTKKISVRSLRFNPLIILKLFKTTKLTFSKAKLKFQQLNLNNLLFLHNSQPTKHKTAMAIWMQLISFPSKNLPNCQLQQFCLLCPLISRSMIMNKTDYFRAYCKVSSNSNLVCPWTNCSTPRANWEWMLCSLKFRIYPLTSK